MNIPGYDAWRLQGPPERDDPVMVECPSCEGDCVVEFRGSSRKCQRCNGMGEVEAEIEEPDGDYEYERRRDAKWENEQ